MNKLYEVRNSNLYYADYCLKDLALKYGTPLKVTFLDLITRRVTNLKSAFEHAREKLNYQGAFIYLNANKANYGYLEIVTSYEAGDGLETSSYYDALLTGKIFRDHKDKEKLIVSNGYKEDPYLDTLIDLHKDGYKVIDVIDSLDEYERLKARNIELEVGLRLHISALYAEEGEVSDDRFGISEEDFNYILKDIENTKLVLTTIHFHQRGFDYEEDKFTLNFKKVFENYYVKAAKKIKTVRNYDMGGGTPLPTSGVFDYEKWAEYVLGLLKTWSKDHGIKEPNLISENGKYSQKDSTVNIYKVITRKETGTYPWYIVNGSLLIALPEHYALGEPIEVTPINDLDKPHIKGLLAGVTCDCDDVFYLEDKGYIELPDSDNLYIGLLGTGSYQNSMNGKGGVHHCLLPEEKDLVIYTSKDGKQVEKIRAELQEISDILKLMKYGDK